MKQKQDRFQTAFEVLKTVAITKTFLTIYRLLSRC